MSQERVRLVNEIYAAINRRDVDAVLALMTADVEYINPPYAVEPGTRVGPQGFAAALANLYRTFPQLEYLVESAEPHGDHVLVTATLQNLGEGGSGMGWPRYHVWTLRGGKACALRWFSDAADARAVVQAGPD